jgi:hypothetical protein
MFTKVYGSREQTVPYTHKLLPNDSGISIAAWTISTRKSHISDANDLQKYHLPTLNNLT